VLRPALPSAGTPALPTGTRRPPRLALGLPSPERARETLWPTGRTAQDYDADCDQADGIRTRQERAAAEVAVAAYVSETLGGGGGGGGGGKAGAGAGARGARAAPVPVPLVRSHPQFSKFNRGPSARRVRPPSATAASPARPPGRDALPELRRLWESGEWEGQGQGQGQGQHGGNAANLDGFQGSPGGGSGGGGGGGGNYGVLLSSHSYCAGNNSAYRPAGFANSTTAGCAGPGQGLSLAGGYGYHSPLRQTTSSSLGLGGGAGGGTGGLMARGAAAREGGGTRLPSPVKRSKLRPCKRQGGPAGARPGHDAAGDGELPAPDGIWSPGRPGLGAATGGMVLPDGATSDAAGAPVASFTVSLLKKPRDESMPEAVSTTNFLLQNPTPEIIPY
jgi:hypothetical protein